MIKHSIVAADNSQVVSALELMTVLYIEDNISNVKLLERIIETRSNVTLLVAMRGGLGLELTFEHSPTMILLDLHLPDMSGEEVLRRVRADERTATTPIFVLSADATPDRVLALLEAGATGYLTKPFDISRLLEIIDSHRSKPVDAVDPVQAVEDVAVTFTTPLNPRTITELHKLEAISGDGPTQVRRLVELFLHDAESRLSELTDATREGDHARIAALAHSLAGSSANLGAWALAAGCRELELEAKSAGTVAATAKVAGLLASFDHARVALRAEFSENQQRVRSS